MNYQHFPHYESFADNSMKEQKKESKTKITLSELLRFATTRQRNKFFLGCFSALSRAILQLSALVLDGWIISSFLPQSFDGQVSYDQSQKLIILLGLGCFLFLIITLMKALTLKTAWMEIVFKIKALYFNSVYYECCSSENDEKMESSIYEMNQRAADFENVHIDIGNFIEGLSVLAFSLFVCFFVSWKHCILLAVTIIFFTTKYSIKVQLKDVDSLNNVSKSAMAVASYCMRNVKTIHSLNCEDFMVEKYKKCLETGHSAALKIHKWNGVFEGIRLFLFHLICGVALGYGFWLYSEQLISQIGDVFIVLSIFFLNLYHFERVYLSLERIGRAQKSLFIFYVLIDRFDEEKEKEGLQMNFNKGNIVFDNVYCNQREDCILKGLTLEIRRGETVGLVGDNVSGKNALYHLLTNNFNYTMGKIIIDGKRIEKISKEEIRESIKIVRANESLFEGTIMENMRMNRPGITEENIKKCAEVALLHEFISKLEHGYNTNLLGNGVILTREHQQLLAIARCIVTEPKILFLDGATSVLSDETEEKLLVSLREHMANRSVIITSDRTYCLERVDRIFVLDDGIVVEKGNHHQLISKQGKYLEYIKKCEKRKAFNSLNLSPLSAKCSIEKRFLEGDKSRFFSNSQGVINMLVGSLVCCFLTSLDKPIFIFICHLLLNNISGTFEPGWVIVSLLIGLLIVWISSALRSILGNICSEKFLENLKVLMFRSFLHEDLNDVERMTTELRSIISIFYMTPSEITEFLDSKTFEVCQLCFSVVLTSLIPWFYVWELALISTVFTAGILFTIMVNCASEYMEDVKTSADTDLDTLRTLRELSAKNYFLQRMLPPTPIETIYVHLLSIEHMMFFDFLSLGIGILLIGNNMYSFNSTVIAFISGHFCQRSLIQLKNDSLISLKFIKFLLKLFRHIHSPQEILAKKNKGIKLDLSGDIQLKRLCFFYPSAPEKSVLNNCNLTIKAGEKVAIYGKPRSGRSTVFHLLQKFYTPSKGSILFDSNNNIEEINGIYLRNQIGYINESPLIFPGTILENITMGLSDVPLQKVREVCKISNFHHFIESLSQGYDSVIGTSNLSLSSGQCQRIALARALIRNPKILLLDRATASTDTQSKEMVEKGLLNASKGRTCVSIVNSLENLESYDKICIMMEGNIVEAGSHNELMELNGQYASMIKSSK